MYQECVAPGTDDMAEFSLFCQFPVFRTWTYSLTLRFLATTCCHTVALPRHPTFDHIRSQRSTFWINALQTTSDRFRNTRIQCSRDALTSVAHTLTVVCPTLTYDRPMQCSQTFGSALPHADTRLSAVLHTFNIRSLIRLRNTT